MAKDDMPVIFCKILIYLYKVLKGKQERDEYYIQPFTKDFPISEDYLETALIELQDFETYKNMSDRIDKELIGIKTQNGILIQGKTYHFIDRVFGSVEERRSGVSIEDVKQALTTPVEIKDTILKGNRISQVFVGEHAKVSVNPDSNILIQVNSNHRKYRNKDRYE